MLVTIIIIVLVGGLLACLLYSVIASIRGHRVIKYITFNSSSIVFGPKGSGKSLLCSLMAHEASKQYGYASNTDFGKKYTHILPKEISVAPNTWENIVEGKIIPIKANPNFYFKPIILDDCSIYLPNYAEGQLKKTHSSMAVAFALWRHFYDAPIHLNTQAVDRTWKLLREQQDVFVLAKGVKKFLFWYVISFRYYDKIDSASNKMKPYKIDRGNKFSKAEKNNFEAHNGIIKDYFLFTRRRIHTYDSRYFHKVFFGCDSPKRSKRM